MELWNCKDLKPPPIYSYESAKDFETLNKLRYTLNNGVKFFKDQRILTLEAALLSRMIYRMKTKLRHEKDFKFAEKVKRPLILFFEMDIPHMLNSVLKLCGQNHVENLDIFPTKNMIHFVLVRLQGLGKLLCRLMDMAKESVKMFESRLRLSHFWQLGLILIALLSRIFVLTLGIVKYTCHLYHELLILSHKVPNFGRTWLPDDYELPENLKTWLGVDWTIIEDTIDISEEIPYFDLAQDSDDDVEICDNYVQVSDDEDWQIIDEFRALPKDLNHKRLSKKSAKKSLTKSNNTRKNDENNVVINLEESLNDDLVANYDLPAESMTEPSNSNKNNSVISIEDSFVDVILSAADKSSEKYLTKLNKSSRKSDSSISVEASSHNKFSVENEENNNNNSNIADETNCLEKLNTKGKSLKKRNGSLKKTAITDDTVNKTSGEIINFEDNGINSTVLENHSFQETIQEISSDELEYQDLGLDKSSSPISCSNEQLDIDNSRSDKKGKKRKRSSTSPIVIDDTIHESTDDVIILGETTADFIPIPRTKKKRKMKRKKNKRLKYNKVKKEEPSF